jgi:hypothetical protein
MIFRLIDPSLFTETPLYGYAGSKITIVYISGDPREICPEILRPGFGLHASFRFPWDALFC